MQRKEEEMDASYHPRYNLMESHRPYICFALKLSIAVSLYYNMSQYFLPLPESNSYLQTIRLVVTDMVGEL